MGENDPHRAAKEATLFTHTCTSCHRRELIFPDQITGLERLDDAFRIHFTCWCDAPQTHLEPRRVTPAVAASQAPSPVAAPVAA